VRADVFFCSFDATYLYQYTFILLYNLVFTSLPVIVLGGTHFLSPIIHSFNPTLQHSTKISTPKRH
jgi:magnesium-transporting ATPase (P-type)